MTVTVVRYPIDYTCSSASFCIYTTSVYPIVSYDAPLLEAHIDATYPWGVTVSFRQSGGLHNGSQITVVTIPAGATDASATLAIPLEMDATGIYFQWIFAQTVATPTHYTGYVDISYGVIEPEPPVSAISSQFVTIVG